jgi:hypothetical protein
MESSVMHSRQVLFVFFLLAGSLLSPTTTFGQKLHPKLKEGKVSLERLVILPAQVALVKNGMKGAEPMEKEAAAAAPLIEQATAQALTRKNLKVLGTPFTAESLQSNEKLKYALADVQRNYAELAAKIIRKQKDVEKGRFTLGDQVLLLNQDDNIDAFVFVQVSGQQNTGGKKTLGALTLNPFLLVSFYFITVTVADARTGDILAHAFTATKSDVTKHENPKLTEVIAKSLKKLPAPTATAKP